MKLVDKEGKKKKREGGMDGWVDGFHPSYQRKMTSRDDTLRSKWPKEQRGELRKAEVSEMENCRVMLKGIIFWRQRSNFNPRSASHCL